MAAQGSDFAEAPDYAGNAALVESTLPPTPRHDRLAVTRTYHPKYLPHYVDEKNSQGEVTRSAASMYAAAIPKVSRAVGSALSPSLQCDYAMNFIIRTMDAFIRGHKFTFYSSSGGHQYGDLDPYTDPYQNPDNKDPPKDDPLKPVWQDPCNKDCPEPMYVVPVLHYTWMDEDGNKHESSTPINPRNGKSEDGADGANHGKIRNNCLGHHKNYDGTAWWNWLMDHVGYGTCGELRGWGNKCGAHEDDEIRHSDCSAKCISQGRATKFNGTQGPYFAEVKPMTGRCGQKIYAPTLVRYDLCWTVDQAKEQCITTDTKTGTYGGLWYDFCSCHGAIIWQRHGLGQEYNLNPNEEHELCIPYEIPIQYGANGCPYIPPNQSKPMGPTEGQNEGDWDSGSPDVYIDFELMPQSQLPSGWLDDDDDTYSQTVGYEIEAYAAFSRSALHRHRTGERT